MRSAGSIASVVCVIGLLLSGCASDSTFTIAGRAPNPKALAEDASDCRSAGPALTGFYGGALLGAASGAQVGAPTGTAPAGAAAGAMLGGLIGLAVGTVKSISGDGYDNCMQKKGYQIASAPMPVPLEPVVLMLPVGGEPAR